jgi:hypothetical protein
MAYHVMGNIGTSKKQSQPTIRGIDSRQGATEWTPSAMLLIR